MSPRGERAGPPLVAALRLANSRRPVAAPRPVFASGLRASVVTTVPVALAVGTGQPLWFWMAIGAWLVALGDTGAAYSTRARAMISIALLGGLLLALWGGLLQLTGVVAPVMLVAGFVLTLVRVLGDVASVVGTLLVVTTVIGLGAPPAQGLEVLHRAAMFVAGGLTSTAVALALWRVRPYDPARAAVAASLEAVAEAARELRALTARPAAEADEGAWSAFVPGFHRQVRKALESAQLAVAATRVSSADVPVTQRLEAILESLDRAFERLVGLADELEASARAGMVPPASLVTLTQLEATLDALRDTLHETSAPSTAPGTAPLKPVADPAIAAAENALVPGPLTAALRTLRAHLTPRSHTFVHAVRVALGTSIAMAIVHWAALPFGTWMVMTTAVCLQRSRAATWSRVFERIVGTVLGAATASLILHLAPYPATVVIVFAGATYAAVSLRPVRNLYFVFFLTPAFGLFAELAQHAEHALEARVLNTLLGGALSIVIATLTFLGADRRRLREDVATALDRARELLDLLIAGRASTDAVRDARRQVGLANNNAEDVLDELAAARGPGRSEREALAAVLAFGRRLVATTVVSIAATRDSGPLGEASQALLARVEALLRAGAAQLRGEPVDPPPTIPEAMLDDPAQPAALRRMAVLARNLTESLATVHAPVARAASRE